MAVKPALGRNLGTLLGGPVSKPVPDLSSAQPQLPLQQPGPGVRSLLRGQHAEKSAPAEAQPQSAQQVDQKPAGALIPRWYFFAADLLLVALALVFIHQCPPGAKWGLRLVSMVLVMLGGCLGLWGVWMGGEKDES